MNSLPGYSSLDVGAQILLTGDNPSQFSIAPDVDSRVTEDGDTRVTETGERRVTE